MASNVWEWCRDVAGPCDQKPRPDDEEWTPHGMVNHVLRGGSCLDGGAEARPARRNEDVPGYRALNFGVRAARAVEGRLGRDP